MTDVLGLLFAGAVLALHSVSERRHARERSRLVNALIARDPNHLVALERLDRKDRTPPAERPERPEMIGL